MISLMLYKGFFSQPKLYMQKKMPLLHGYIYISTTFIALRTVHHFNMLIFVRQQLCGMQTQNSRATYHEPIINTHFKM